MELTEPNLIQWKIDSIAHVTSVKDAFVISSGGIDLTGTTISDSINGITYTNSINPLLIKSQLTSLYTYVSLKYMTIFKENNIDPIDICTNNSLLTITPTYNLPEANTMDQYFTLITTEVSGSPSEITIEANSLFTNLKSQIELQPTLQTTAWNDLPNLVQASIQEKILYQLFQSPESIDVFKLPVRYLLDDMQLKQLIINLGMNDDFHSIFPEIPLL